MQPITVSELTARIKVLLERNFTQVAVIGEVSNLSARKHLYFTIKDRHAALDAIIWQSTWRRMSIRPEEGQSFCFYGRITVYEPRGRYQLIVERMEPVGLGALAAEIERRKQRLRAEGLFDAERKRPIPRLPQRIAVVTSPEGAAWRDVQKVLATRPGWLEVVLVPCLVQGDQAPASIVRALAQAAALAPDVILLVRGGGSLEDLMAFNDERVVRAVAASPIPVITGVGHETDTTLVDLAADLRAATPSHAAERCCPSREELRQALHRLLERLHRLAHQRARVAEVRLKAGLAQLRERRAGWLAHHRTAVARLEMELERLTRTGLARRKERALALARSVRHLPPMHRRQRAVGAFAQRLARAVHARLRMDRARLQGAHDGLTREAQRALARPSARLERLARKLEALHAAQQAEERAILKKGYAKCLGADGHVRVRAAQLKPEDEVRLCFYDDDRIARILSR